MFFRTTAILILQSTSHLPAADRHNPNIGSYQHRRRQADTASVLHSVAICAIVVLWLCGSLPRSRLSPPAVFSKAGRKNPISRAPAHLHNGICSSHFVVPPRLCQGASPQEGKQLRRVRLQHPCALKVSASAPRLSYNAPLVPPSSST